MGKGQGARMRKGKIELNVFAETTTGKSLIISYAESAADLFGLSLSILQSKVNFETGRHATNATI